MQKDLLQDTSLLKLSKVNDRELSRQPEGKKAVTYTVEIPLDYHRIFQQKPYKPGDSGMKYLKY